MAWTEEMVQTLQVLLADPDGTTYSTDTLEKTLAVAALQVCQELPAFKKVFSVKVSDSAITPDPTEGDDKDDSFANLVCMKAACITDRGSAATAANQAIAVKDGSSSIDLRGILAGKLKMLEKGGWCAAYTEAKRDYQTGTAGKIAGAAIMTPFRTVAGGLCRGVYVINGRTGC